MVSAIYLTTAGADPDNLRDGKLLAKAIRFAGTARSEPVDLDGSCVSLSLMTGIPDAEGHGSKDHHMDEPRDVAGNGPSLGVLIIGSLYWDNSIRDKWRRERLDLERRQYVRAPIRYGRRSERRGHSYTMVFSAGLREADFGTAIAVPCRSRDLIAEASAAP